MNSPKVLSPTVIARKIERKYQSFEGGIDHVEDTDESEQLSGVKSRRKLFINNARHRANEKANSVVKFLRGKKDDEEELLEALDIPKKPSTPKRKSLKGLTKKFLSPHKSKSETTETEVQTADDIPSAVNDINENIRQMSLFGDREERENRFTNELYDQMESPQRTRKYEQIERDLVFDDNFNGRTLSTKSSASCNNDRLPGLTDDIRGHMYCRSEVSDEMSAFGDDFSSGNSIADDISEASGVQSHMSGTRQTIDRFEECYRMEQNFPKIEKDVLDIDFDKQQDINLHANGFESNNRLFDMLEVRESNDALEEYR